MAMSLVGTLELRKLGRANSLPFSLIAPGTIRSRRSAAESTCLFSAARSPEIFWPVAVVPLNVNTGIVFLLSRWRRPPPQIRLYLPDEQSLLVRIAVLAASYRRTICRGGTGA